MPEIILSSGPRQWAPLQSVGPGERVVDGRVYDSAVWLTAALGADAVGIEPTDGDDNPKEETIDVTVKFTLEGRGGEANTAEWVARLVAQLLREEGLDVGERGVGVRADRPCRHAEGGMKLTEDDGLLGEGEHARAPVLARGGSRVRGA